jgi:hypothetical protein
MMENVELFYKTLLSLGYVGPFHILMSSTFGENRKPLAAHLTTKQ